MVPAGQERCVRKELERPEREDCGTIAEASDQLPFVWNPTYMTGSRRKDGAPSARTWVERELLHPEAPQDGDTSGEAEDFVASMTIEHARNKQMLKGLMPNATENKLDEVAT